MKNVIVFAIAASVLLSCTRKTQPVETKKTEKEWKFIFTEKKKYFMKFNGGDTLHASFEYYNNTGEKQLIDTIKRTCTCTDIEYEHRPIGIGEKGKIDVTIDLEGTEGYFSKSIAVYFHGQNPVVLQVMGKK